MIVEAIIGATGLALGAVLARRTRPDAPRCRARYFGSDRCTARCDPRCVGGNCTEHCRKHCGIACLGPKK